MGPSPPGGSWGREATFCTASWGPGSPWSRPWRTLPLPSTINSPPSQVRWQRAIGARHWRMICHALLMPTSTPASRPLQPLHPWIWGGIPQCHSRLSLMSWTTSATTVSSYHHHSISFYWRGTMRGQQSPKFKDSPHPPAAPAPRRPEEEDIPPFPQMHIKAHQKDPR